MAEKKTLYVCRKLSTASAAALLDWANAQGFETTLPADELHVTVAYSKAALDWDGVGDSFDTVQDGPRSEGREVKQLGPEGAVVLAFEQGDLQRRWEQIKDAGASWDWDDYTPHVTFTYQGGSVDLAKVPPFDGLIVLGPEVFEPLDDERKPGGAMDQRLAMDKMLAFDRASVRSYDQDGRLRVEIANISKATVNPYMGNEIPDADVLGLDPKKVYQLLRDPEELAKAVPTFNGIPLLDQHVPSTAWDHPSGKVVGTTGTDSVFEAPYLKNSLVVWTADAITGIENGEQQELSCGYRYRADMTPGTHDGVSYDGVMRDILGNHVALVAAGRAGPDVVVGDAQPGTKETGMTKVKALSRRAAMARGALMVALKPTMLAADAKIDYSTMLEGVTAKNWKESKPKIAAAIKPKLAADADLQDVVKLLDTLDAVEEGMDDDPTVVPAAVDADPMAEILAMCKGKLSDDELAAMGEKLKALKPAAAAVDVVPPALKPVAEGEGGAAKETVTKAAMDAALKAASDDADKRIKLASEEAEKSTMTRLNAIAEAQTTVQPFVGKLAGAFDSAESVYRAALTNLGVKHEGIHASALRAVLEAQPKADSQPRMAGDSRPEGIEKRFPGLAAVRVI